MVRALGPTAAVVAALVATAPFAQEAVAPRVALAAMVRMLAYDRTLAARGSGDFVVAVGYEPGQESDRDEIVQAASALTFHKRPVRAVAVELKALKDEAARQPLSAVVVLRGSSPAALETARQAAEAANVYALTLDPAHVESGRAAIGVASRQGKPQIVLSLKAAKRLNASFEAAALKMAKLYP